MLTKNICSEYGQYNIQCNAIGPGYIATPQTAPLRAKQADGSMAPFDRFIRSKTPAHINAHTKIRTSAKYICHLSCELM